VSTEEASSNAEETEDASKRPSSVQDMQAELVGHVYTLAKAGVFKGHASFQAILTYYMFNTARYDSEPRGFKQAHVMPGCTFPAAVAKATNYTTETVRQANVWLHQQRLIEITELGTSIKILYWDHHGNEEERKKLLDEEGLATAPERKSGPRPKRSRKITTQPEGDDETPTQLGIDRNSVGDKEPGNPNSVGTYSSRSSSTFQTSTQPDRAQKRASCVEADKDEEEGKRAPASPPPGDAVRDPQEIFDSLLGQIIVGYADDYSVRRADAKRTVITGLRSGRWNDKINYLQRHMRDFGIDDDGRLEIIRYHADKISYSDDSRQPRTERAATRRAAPKAKYDNTFRFGVSKDGVPYFSRGGKSHKSDDGTATLTPQEAAKFFHLQKEDEAAWIDFKHELYEKYRAA
jgi:hypothetical protein